MHPARRKKGKRHYPVAGFRKLSHAKGVGNLGLVSDWKKENTGHKMVGTAVQFGKLPGNDDLAIRSVFDGELKSNPRLLKYKFRWRGYANVPRAVGLTKILRELQADKKGPWTKKPFWFNGRKVRPGHWQIGKFDRLHRKEISLTRPVNKVQKHPLDYDDKLDFESRAQMNAQFENRFSK